MSTSSTLNRSSHVKPLCSIQRFPRIKDFDKKQNMQTVSPVLGPHCLPLCLHLSIILASICSSRLKLTTFSDTYFEIELLSITGTDSNFEICSNNKVNKGAKIRNRYNQVPHLTQDTYGKATNSQLDTTNESQEVSPFPAGVHKAHINRRTQRHSKHKTEKKDPQKKYRLGTVSKIFD